MKRRMWASALVAALGVAGLVAVDDSLAAVGALEDTPLSEIPVPEPGFLEPVPAGTCEPENAYEEAQWDATVGGTIAGNESDCKRLRFAYGPIPVRPGQNDALLVPVTIEKPAYDGYALRFKPDLVVADGTAPPVDQIHLHHSVWLRTDEALDFPPSQYDDDIIPFFASGEEKTTGLFPQGYGYEIGGTDSWLLLYMVHNYTTSTESVWITYDVDYVATDSAAAADITSIHPVWLDVQRRPIVPGAPNTPANPVFNTQAGFGHFEDSTGQPVDPSDPDARRVCTWPDENCAKFDPYGNVTPQQGIDVSDQVDGAYETVDLELRGANTGTLVWMGGHLHPGGERNDVDLVRPGQGSRRIFTSEGVAWDRDVVQDPDGLGVAGAPLDSWDFSMTTTGAQFGWKVNIQPDDKFRINATYDSSISWYENMGIVVGFVAPDEESGIDVFNATVVDGVPTNAPRPESGWDPPDCTPGPSTLCTRGVPTHAHLPEAGNYGGDNLQPLDAVPGTEVDQIAAAGFTYGLADQNVIRSTGEIPTVEVGSTVQVVNADTAGDVWHTVTRCQEPCSGASGLAYPKADFTDAGTNFDSSEIGYGLFYSPAKAHVDEEFEELLRPPYSSGDIGTFADEMDDGVLWEFTPDQSDVGTVTFYCRIHIGMRGAVEVVDAGA